MISVFSLCCQACRRSLSRGMGKNTCLVSRFATLLWLLCMYRKICVFLISRLFTKLVLEAPIITESALEVIRRYCEDEVKKQNTKKPSCTPVATSQPFLQHSVSHFLSFQSRVYLGMTTLKELIVKRPSRQFQYLHVLLDLSSNEKEKVMLGWARVWSVLVLNICSSISGAHHCLGFSEAHVWERPTEGLHREVCSKLPAASGSPQPAVFALWSRQGYRFVHNISDLWLWWCDLHIFASMLFAFVDTEVAAPWTEETVRQCLFLYLSLLPLNHRLVHELASVYTEAIADIKRSVLRAIEQPVRLSSLICLGKFGLFES